MSLPLLLFDTWMTVYVCRVLGIRVWQFLTACNMRVAVPAILAGGILAWLSTLYYPRSWVALGVAVLLFETAFLGLVWLLTLTSRERTLFLETARLRTVRLALGNLIPKYGASRS
ncbi:MAG: hypothetical protein HYU29_09490 [Chloroflexi bacterium]|nr:hypothetical protein [Chloroflexota bacterium]